MRNVLVVLGLVAGYLIGRRFAPPRAERDVQAPPPPPLDDVPAAGESARAAPASIREFGVLVERLTARDVAVDDVLCEPGTRWRLGVESGADADRYRKSSLIGKTGETRWATRVSWTAGDADLRVEKSVRLPNLAPNQWKDEPAVPIGPDGDATRAAEAFILERFAQGAAGESARRSAAFVRDLAAFADRLAARDVYVRKLSGEPCWFWELVLQPGAHADRGESPGQTELTRVFWDGKEYDLSVASAPWRPLRRAKRLARRRRG